MFVLLLKGKKNNNKIPQTYFRNLDRIGSLKPRRPFFF